MFDVMVMFGMGVLGYVMVLLHFPRAPLLIGFVLGPLLENTFRQSLIMSHGQYDFFISSFIAKVFWGLTALYLLSALYKLIRHKPKATTIDTIQVSPSD